MNFSKNKYITGSVLTLLIGMSITMYGAFERIVDASSGLLFINSGLIVSAISLGILIYILWQKKYSTQ